MIADALLGLLHGLLAPVLGLLPSSEPPWHPYTTGGTIAEYLAPIERVLPFMAPLKSVLTVVAVTFPALLAYRIGLFIFNRVRGS